MENKSSFRRIAVNGKLLTVKQTVQFEKFMAESEGFRIQFAKLAKETGIL